MRVIIATQHGVVLDHNDIDLVRLGHRSGSKIFDASGEACNEHYRDCGLEWRASDGSLGNISGREMLVQMTGEGTLAVACILSGHERSGGPVSEPMPPKLPWARAADPAAGKPQSWWRRIFRNERVEQKIFFVRRDLPDDFLPIR